MAVLSFSTVKALSVLPDTCKKERKSNKKRQHKASFPVFQIQAFLAIARLHVKMGVK